jgi:hypothetical protein
MSYSHSTAAQPKQLFAKALRTAIFIFVQEQSQGRVGFEEEVIVTLQLSLGG